MHRGGVNNTNGRYHQRHHHNKNQAIDFSHFLADPSPSSDPDQPESSSSLRRHIAQTLMKHHRSIENNNHALQPVSPASYGSSMEVAPYNPAVTPGSSISFRGRIDQQACRREIDGLMKQIAEDKLVRKSKEQDRIHAAVQSARDELEDERKLRKRSENLHRKLAHEVFESKVSLSNALKDLDRERKSRKLLEDLAMSLRRQSKATKGGAYTKTESNEDWTARRSSVWFLQTESNSGQIRRKSLESIPLNEAGKDACDEEDSASSDSNCFELNKPSSVDMNSHEDEALNYDGEELQKSNHAEKNFHHEKIKSQHPSGLQIKSEEKMGRATSNENKKSQLADSEQVLSVGNTTEATISEKQATQYGNKGRKNKLDEMHGLSSNYVLDNLIRNHIALSEGGNMNEENNCGEASCSKPPWKNQPSPVRQWMTKITPPDVDVSKSSLKLPQL
ncbi:Lactoylglutathione lyase / glyoxalase I family protein [Hibiscus syriacus]|uniref:Lactoylglutathione lyase / glyoxalase I family protein n=1 Tax=Hibiscus syriacus TaxID=106335 RepID=A0A6A2YWS0_HIBSY|nr:Lactoylglutathione lyase / glyoxalase I family protein [Hibiscus syriacus]